MSKPSWSSSSKTSSPCTVWRTCHLTAISGCSHSGYWDLESIPNPQGTGESILLWWGHKPWDKKHSRNLCSSHFQVSVTICVSDKIEEQEKSVSKVLLTNCRKSNCFPKSKLIQIKVILIWLALLFYRVKLPLILYMYMYKKYTPIDTEKNS